MKKPSSFVQVYANPFAAASYGAKIPDGKSTLSVGQRFQQRDEYVTDENGLLEMMLFPGINNCLMVRGDGHTIAKTGLPVTNHGAFAFANSPPDQNVTQSSASEMNKWRTVSCGMTVKTVNTFDDNDGWFEAIRVTHNRTDAMPVYLDAGTQKVVPGIDASAQGNSNVMPWIDSQANLVENPSYISGSLREMSMILFKLTAHAEDHDFQELGKRFEASELVDGSFDTIYVRIYGRAAKAGVTPTRILVHTCHNQEIMYDEGSALSRFHGKSYTSQHQMATVAAVDRASTKAGLMVSNKRVRT